MTERLIVLVLNTSRGSNLSWVRIPLHPPQCLQEVVKFGPRAHSNKTLEPNNNSPLIIPKEIMTRRKLYTLLTILTLLVLALIVYTSFTDITSLPITILVALIITIAVYFSFKNAIDLDIRSREISNKSNNIEEN